MADNKKSFVLYADYIHTVKKLPLDKAGELFMTILSYVNDENPSVNDILVDIVFEPIKQQLKRDLVKYETTKQKRAENGRVGGLKSGEVRKQNEANGNTDEANEANASNKEANEADNDNDNVTVTVNDNDILREGNVTIPTAPQNNFLNNNEKRKKSRMPPPKYPEDAKEVEIFMFNKMKNRWDIGFVNLQANKFYEHYNSNGWKQSKGNKIVNWHSAVNMWVFRELERQGPKPFAQKQPLPATPVTPVVTALPLELTADQKERKNIDFIEAIYNEYCVGVVVEAGIPADIYTVLNQKNILVLSQQDKDRISSECAGDNVKARKKAVSEYFKSLKDEGRECVFELAPT